MKNVLLSSMVLVAVLSGCGGDGSCCDAQPIEEAIGTPPVAKITGISDPTVISLGQSVTVNGIASSDRDGDVTSYKWTVDGEEKATEQSPTFTFNTPGDHEICLTVTDNDNQESVNMECKTVTVKGRNSVTPVNPTAVISLSNDEDFSAYSKHLFSCEKSHDNDTLGVGNEIVSCEWDIQSYAIDSNGNIVPYKNCTAEAMNNQEIFICPNASKIIAKLKVTDNDGQVHSTTKEYILK
jgi:PKD repeat protein